MYADNIANMLQLQFAFATFWSHFDLIKAETSTKRRPATKIKIQSQPIIDHYICLSNQFNEGLKNLARVKENPASDPISPPTPRHHKDVHILKRTTASDPNSTSYLKPYSYLTPAHLDGYRWDTLKSGLHVQDPVYRPRSLSSSDAGISLLAG